MAEQILEPEKPKHILRKKGAPKEATSGADLAAQYAIMQGVRGRDFEGMFFGEKIRWTKIAEKYGVNMNSYMDPQECIKFITEHYPPDRAILPETKVCRDLYDYVAEGLKMDSENIEFLEKHLRFYNSLNTSLDFYNGVDGFFEYIDPQGRHIYCALDTTQNPYKQEYKADVKIMGFPDFRKAPNDYLKWLDFISQQIIHTLQTKRTNWI